MGFPPGLIPQLVRVKADTDPPYSPLSPLDIERAGLPSPAEPDAYLASRLDRFYAELRVRLPLEPLACSVVDVQRSDAMSQDACTIEQELQDVMDRFWVVHLSQASYQLKVAHLRHVQTYLAFITLHKPSSLSQWAVGALVAPCMVLLLLTNLPVQDYRPGAMRADAEESHPPTNTQRQQLPPVDSFGAAASDGSDPQRSSGYAGPGTSPSGICYASMRSSHLEEGINL